jgi:hypothetical protein
MKRTVVNRKRTLLTKAGVHKSRLPGRVGNKLCSGATVFNLLDVTLQARRILRWFLCSWEICALTSNKLLPNTFFFDVCLETVATSELPMCCHLTSQFNECSWCVGKHCIRCEIPVSFNMNVGFVFYHI